MKKRIRKNREMFALAFESVALIVESTIIDIMAEENVFTNISKEQKVVALIVTVNLAMRLGIYDDMVKDMPKELAEILNNIVEKQGLRIDEK